MSKRDGNFITLHEVFNQVGKDPLRYFEDIERQVRDGDSAGHWRWVDSTYGTDEDAASSGVRGEKPFTTTAKKWTPRKIDIMEDF